MRRALALIASALAVWALWPTPTPNRLDLLEGRVEGGLLLLLATALLICRAPWLWRGLTIAAGTTTILAFSLEILLHLVVGPSPPSWDTPDPVLHHRLVPGVVTQHVTGEWDVEVRVNDEGARDDPRRLQEGGILLLGDSFAWGWGVRQEEAFPQLLERELGIEVWNFAVPSWSPTIHRRWLAGWAGAPRAVVLCLDLSDLQDDLLYARLGSGGAFPPPPPAGFPLLLGRVWRRTWAGLYAHVPHKPPVVEPDLLVNRYAHLRDAPAIDEEAHWERTFAEVEGIAAWAAAHDARFTLVTTPYGVEVGVREWDEGRYTYGFGSDERLGDRPFRRVAAEAALRGWPLVETLPAFLEAEQTGPPLFFAWDGHFTPRGHTVAAQAIARAIQP